MDYSGRLVQYLDRKRSPRLARVTDQKGKRLHIIDQFGRNTRIPMDDVLADYSAPGSDQDLQRLAERMVDTQDEIDLQLLWSEVCESKRSYRGHELAEIFFGTPTMLQEGALILLLLDHDLLFELTDNAFLPLTPEAAAAKREERKQAQLQMEYENRARKWLRKVLNTRRRADVPEDLEILVQNITAYFRLNTPNEGSRLLAQAGSDEMSLRAQALDVLIKTGNRTPDDESLLEMAQLERDFPDAVQRHAADITPDPDRVQREDFTHLLCFSIDDDETREIDDALSVEKTDVGLRIRVHIADAANFVRPGDPVDEVALRRGATIYMPAGFVPLLPEHISCDLASLRDQVERPALSFVIQLDQERKPVDFRIARSRIRIDRRLNYEDADELIESGQTPLATCLQQLSRVSTTLAERRRADGAMTIEKTETKVRVDDQGGIKCKGIPTSTPSRDLVGEMMILANHLTAKLAAAEDIPIIYRTQPPPDMPAAANLGKVVQDTDMNVFRGLKPGKLSLHPGRHALLGLDAYTQITSPLRRYADLVLQRQLVAWLQKEPPPHSTAELFEVLGNAEMIERENRRLSREAERYWQLEFLARHHRQDILTARPVGKYAASYLCALQPHGVRGKLATKEHLRFGEEIHVRISDLDPALGIIKLQLTD